MKFVLAPILDKMKHIYQQPRDANRFKNYLHLLQGSSQKDMLVPIAGYNPMGGPQVLDKLRELQALNCEAIIQKDLASLNASIEEFESDTFEIVVNIVDDLNGAWSNYYTTDFSSKFSLNAFVERKFCTPHFWTSESYSEDLVLKRYRAYAFRTVHWIRYGKPITLEDHLRQEIFVSKQLGNPTKNIDHRDIEDLFTYFNSNKESEDYNLIFNFFYGDEACKSLGYSTMGIQPNAGFLLAEIISGEQQQI